MPPICPSVMPGSGHTSLDGARQRLHAHGKQEVYQALLVAVQAALAGVAVLLRGQCSCHAPHQPIIRHPGHVALALGQLGSTALTVRYPRAGPASWETDRLCASRTCGGGGALALI